MLKARAQFQISRGVNLTKFGIARQCDIDPKPDELALGRLNPGENREEDRTGGLFNTFG